MGAGEKINLSWPGKESVLTGQKRTAEKLKQTVYPRPLTEKTLFTPEIEERKVEPADVNRSFLGDNLEVMEQLIGAGYENNIDLIYIDPPYMSSSNYHAKTLVEGRDYKKTISRLVFTDTWKDDINNYLTHIYPRLQMMYRLLKENGSIFVHLDWHISHYVKILLDEIFSPRSFINEIVWCYSGGSGAGKHFQRKHDVILWYVKGPDYIFHPRYRPYSEGTRQRGLTQVKGDKYQLNEKGANFQDWWSDINKILSPTARENLKFPTQKPIALSERIIAAASDPDSLVADFYSGSGTTAAACEKLGRSWICCDLSPLAIDTMSRRLIKSKSRPFSLEIDQGYIKPENAGIKIETTTTQSGEDTIDINIFIKEFVPRRENVPGDSPALFIHFWEVDLDHDGRDFHSDIQVLRNTAKYDDSLCLDINVRVPVREPLYIAVMVHDLWGDITMARLKIESMV